MEESIRSPSSYTEESGWTSYFDDFCEPNKNQRKISATSSKKRKKKETFITKGDYSDRTDDHDHHDDSLEDTAISPLTIYPQICALSHYNLDQKNMNDQLKTECSSSSSIIGGEELVNGLNLDLDLGLERTEMKKRRILFRAFLYGF